MFHHHTNIIANIKENIPNIMDSRETENATKSEKKKLNSDTRNIKKIDSQWNWRLQRGQV